PPPCSSHPYRAAPHLHSFPTRRSSDLHLPALEPALDLQDPRAGGDPDHRAARRLTLVFRGSRRQACLDPVGHARSPIRGGPRLRDRKSTRLNSSHVKISYAVFCLKKKK